MRTVTFLPALVWFLTLPLAARADSYESRTTTIGYLTEHADIVAVADLAAETVRGRVHRARFAVTEVIRGETEVGADLVLTLADRGFGVPWRAGAKHLLFLVRRGEGATARLSPLTGVYGVRAAPPEKLIGMARDTAATLGPGGKVREPGRLLGLLLRWIGDEDAGTAWTGAMDLVRHHELVERLSTAGRETVLAAFGRAAIGTRAKEALATAVAFSGHPEAGRVLVRSLTKPGARTIRGAVGDALERLPDPTVPGRIVKALDGAGPEARAALVQVLGRVGGKAEARAARKLLADPEPEVRIEAAHALGRIARNVRKKDPEARIEGRKDLHRMLLGAKTANGKKAPLWALAQLDDPKAFDLLRRLATDSPDPLVRRWARHLLKNPRQSLILRW